MKHILHNTICLLLIAIPLQAQNAMEKQPADITDNLQGQRPEHLTYEEMTDLMTNELHLDEKQQTKLAKINRRFKTLIEGEQHPPMMGEMGGGPSGDMDGGNHMGNHQGGGRMGGMSGGPMGGGMSGGPMGGGMSGGPMGGMGGGPMGGGPGGHEAYNYDRQQQKYDKKVRKLLTDDQYEGYQHIKSQFYSQRRIHGFLMGE